MDHKINLSCLAFNKIKVLKTKNTSSITCNTSPNINDDIFKHLKSLGNLNTYLLPKNGASVSFGRLSLRGTTVTSGHSEIVFTNKNVWRVLAFFEEA